MAVHLSRTELFRRAANQSILQAPCLSQRIRESAEEGDQTSKGAKEGYVPHLPALFRDASTRGRRRHPNRAGPARTQGRAHDHDLHARDGSWHQLEKPTRQALKAAHATKTAPPSPTPLPLASPPPSSHRPFQTARAHACSLRRSSPPGVQDEQSHRPSAGRRQRRGGRP